MAQPVTDSWADVDPETALVHPVSPRATAHSSTNISLLVSWWIVLSLFSSHECLFNGTRLCILSRLHCQARLVEIPNHWFPFHKLERDVPHLQAIAVISPVSAKTSTGLTGLLLGTPQIQEGRFPRYLRRFSRGNVYAVEYGSDHNDRKW